mgnify:CR=1 FL=1
MKTLTKQEEFRIHGGDALAITELGNDTITWEEEGLTEFRNTPLFIIDRLG